MCIYVNDEILSFVDVTDTDICLCVVTMNLYAFPSLPLLLKKQWLHFYESHWPLYA